MKACDIKNYGNPGCDLNKKAHFVFVKPKVDDEVLAQFDKQHNVMQDFIQRMQIELARKKDDLIKQAMINAGIDIADTEFIKINCQRIIIDGDKFEHFYLYYNTPEEVRIISIERMPSCDMVNEPDFRTNFNAWYKYY